MKTAVEASKSDGETCDAVCIPIPVWNPSHPGCGHNHFIVPEGVSKSKETLHTYVEGHLVVETKYGLTVSTDDESLLATTVFYDLSHDKAASNA